MSVERLDKDKDADENVDADQISTVRPVKSEQSVGLFTQRQGIEVDFRVSGLPHAVVKQADNFRVRELVKKIESHPHQEALQADSQQNNVHNPFSDDSKAMVHEMRNVEFFELCETIPKVQWDISWLKANPVKILVNGDGMLSQFRAASSRRRETPRSSARQNRKRCIKKNYDGIHDRFKRDPVYRDSQLKIGWTEEQCIAMDKLAQEDHSDRLSSEECERYQKNWYLTLNKSGKNAPMRLRSDFRQMASVFFFQFFMVAVG